MTARLIGGLELEKEKWDQGIWGDGWKVNSTSHKLLLLLGTSCVRHPLLGFLLQSIYKFRSQDTKTLDLITTQCQVLSKIMKYRPCGILF